MYHKLDVVENVLIVCGVTVSLAQIQQIMGIILLCFQVVLIITKAIIKIINAIKNKKLDEAVKSIEDAQKEIDDRTGQDKK